MGVTRAHGHFRVEHGSHRVARAIGWLLRLPLPSAESEIQLVIRPRTSGDEWVRSFDGRRLVTTQQRLSESEFLERFGLLEFRFRNEPASGATVHHHQQAAAIRVGRFRMRIPPPLAPRVIGREEMVSEHRRKITVQVTLPVVGLLLRYDGLVDFTDEC